MRRFGATILSIIIVFSVIKYYRIYSESQPTPKQAVESYIDRVAENAPRKAEEIHIVSATSPHEEGTLTVLFRATEQPSQIHLAGYATLRKTLFGWYVDRLQMAGKSPLPEDMMANVERLESGPVIFGQVFLPNAAKVEAIFDDPNQGQIITSAEIPAGNFVLFGSRFNELAEFRILDSSGNTLKKFFPDELD